MRRVLRAMKKATWWQKCLVIILVATMMFWVGKGVFASLFGGAGGQNQNSSVELDKGLVGWWKMKGNAKDASPYGNDGSVSGGTLTTDRNGNANAAYSFSGTGGITISNPLGQTAANEVWTVSAWVNLSSGGPNANQYMVSGMNSGNYLNYGTTNKMLLYLNGGVNDYYMYGTQSLRDSTWHHVVFAFRNSDGFRKVYIDGVDDSSSGPNLTSTPLGLNSTFILGNSITGSISDLRIYNRVLSQAEISTLTKSSGSGLQVSDSQKGLFGWWKMDGNGKDASPRGYDFTLTGSSGADRNGNTGKAWSFTAGNAYSAANSSGFATTNNLTLSMWIKLDATGTYYAEHIIMKQTSTSDANFVWYLFGNYLGNGDQGKLRLYANAGGSWQAISGTYTLPVGTWVHASVSYDSSLGGQLYINGQPVGGRTGSGALATNSQPIQIESPDMTLDDMRLYNRSLSQSEIQNLYDSYETQSAGASLTTGLVGSWQFNGNAKDATPYGNNGTITGATLTTDRKGNANSAYTFDGTSNYISVPITSGSALSGSAESVMLWVKANNTNYALMGDLSNWDVRLFDASWTIVDSGSTYHSVSVPGINDNNWHQVGFTYDGTNLKGYVDGQLTSTVASPSLLPINTGSVWWFGQACSGTCGGKFYAGSLDDVRIWKRALTPNEVAQFYAETR